MKIIIGLLLLSIAPLANANECYEELWQQKKDISQAFQTEITLENHFTYITSIAGFREEAHKDGAINMINKIDQDLYVRIAEVIHYSKSKSNTYQKGVISAIEHFIKDTEYYPLTWTQEELEELEELNNFMSSVFKNDV